MSTTAKNEQLLKPREVAQRLRLNVATVYRRISSGELAAFRLSESGRGPLRIPERALLEQLRDTAAPAARGSGSAQPAGAVTNTTTPKETP